MTTTTTPHVDAFLKWIGERRSENTEKTYGYALLAFERSNAELTHSGVEDFVRWVRTERGDGTVKTYIAALSKFVWFLTRYELVNINPHELAMMREDFNELRKTKKTKLLKLPPDDDVNALLSAVNNAMTKDDKGVKRLEHLRNIAMILSLHSSGMRVGEMVGLKRDDLDYRKKSAIVTGKGNKQRVVYFDNETWSAITNYLRERDGTGRSIDKDIPVFSQHWNREKRVVPLTTNRVRQIFRNLCSDANIEFNLTPHTLRHNFATKVLEATGNLAAVQDMLGHASPETTRIYAKVSDMKLSEAHRQAFPH